MKLSSRLDQLHTTARQNKWLQYFTTFNRIALAAGFLPAGFVKITGERFTSLSSNHPMGHYLEALHHTGYYYTFIGIAQITAAILLLIPRTVTLGALIYFPIIINISILSLAVRFEGSLLTSPLMVLSNLYLLCWNYDKLKFILPIKHTINNTEIPPQKTISNKFPVTFFAGVIAAIIIVTMTITNIYSIMPHNTISDCRQQANNSSNPTAVCDFCDCIHKEGQPLDKCLNKYNKTLKDQKQKK